MGALVIWGGRHYGADTCSEEFVCLCHWAGGWVLVKGLVAMSIKIQLSGCSKSEERLKDGCVRGSPS